MRQMNQYYYNHIDGTTPLVIVAGENGVTQELIDFLVNWETKYYGNDVYRATMELSYDDAIGGSNLLHNYDSPENDMERLVRQCVDRLKPEQQKIYYEIMGMQKSYSEVGRERNITKQAIYCRMNTIKKNIRQMLEEYM